MELFSIKIRCTFQLVSTSKEEYGCISFNKQSELSGKMYDVMPDFTGKVIQSSILTD